MLKIREVKGFISYSQQDENYFEKFKKLLDSVIKTNSNKSSYKISIWTDRKILAGENWHQVIQDSLNKSDFAIFLVSNDFFGSDYIKKHEYSKAREAKKLIIPIELTSVLDKNQFDELGQVQYFVYKPFSRGETLGGKFDKESDEKEWQMGYINKFYTNLVDLLNQYLPIEEDEVQPTDKFLKVEQIPHIRDVMIGHPKRDLKTVLPSDLVIIASNKMRRFRVRHLLVIENNELKGVLSRRDVAKIERDYKSLNSNIIESGPKFKTMKVSEIMINNVISCSPEDTIASIVDKFAEKQPIGTGLSTKKKISIGSLAVLKDSEPIEIITYTDILVYWKSTVSDAQIQNLETLTAKDLMTKFDAIERLNQEEILAFAYDLVTREFDPRRAIPIVTVLDDKELRGMISDLRVFEIYGDVSESKEIREFMREKDVDLTNYFSKETSFQAMIETFISEKDLTSLPVIEGDKIIGIVSYTDLLKKINNELKPAKSK